MAQEKPFGRSLSDFGNLKPAEQKLLEACRVGDPAELGDEVPGAASDENCVRADFLRFLLLGGDEQVPIHERGVALCGAFILGELDLSGCHIRRKASLKLCRIWHQFIATSTRFDGGLDLEGSYLGKGLQANFLSCEKNLVLSGGFRSVAEIQLQGAQIGGDFNCKGGKFQASQGVALSAVGMNVFGSALFNDGFEAIGEFKIMDAQIKCNLNCNGGKFINESGTALFADRICVQGSVFFRDGFKAKGLVRLMGAQIGSNLECIRGSFEVIADCAFDANRINVKGSVFLSQGFKAFGSVNFSGAKIGSNFDCKGGHFTVEEGYALTVNRASIHGSVFLNEKFKSIGVVHMLGAKIDGNLNCNQGDFKTDEGFALNLQTIVVKGVWHMSKVRTRVLVNATHADVAVLDDDADSWAQGSVLDGFNYKSISHSDKNLGAQRLIWLGNQYPPHLSNQNFRPQPWRQLQRVLREMGHSEDAKQVGIAFEDHQRKIGRMGEWPNDPCDVLRCFKGILTRTAHYIFGKLAGYGYRPVNLVMWMLAAWLLCGGIYWVLARSPFNAMAPSDPLVFQDARYSECRPTQEKQLDSVEKKKVLAEPTIGNWPFCSDMPGEYSTFSPLVYSLDLLLPVVDLGQEKSWGSFIPSPNESAAEESVLHWRWGYLVRFVAWFETLFGWVSSLLLVAIISGFSRRNDEE